MKKQKQPTGSKPRSTARVSLFTAGVSLAGLSTLLSAAAVTAGMMNAGLPDHHVGFAGKAPSVVSFATVTLPMQQPSQVALPVPIEPAAPAEEPAPPTWGIEVAEAPAQEAPAVPLQTATSETLPELDTGPSDQEKRTATQALAEGLARLNLALSLQTVQKIALHRQEQAAQLALAEAPETAAEAETGELPLIDADLSSSEPLTTASIPSHEVPITAEPLVLASLSPDVIPVPSLRPRPLVRTSPSAVNKPAQSSGPVLSYANPGNPESEENGVFSGIKKLFNSPTDFGPDSKVAIYDISAATVHMPDGSKLKANSGIGHRMNNPKYAYVKNLGPTPPNVYKLRMRERRFHGVEAIRMLPYDVAAMRGRDGMLAHTPLLRNSKGSHGCVAFPNYNKFLKAFKRGKVKTMIVVPEMSALPKYAAMYKERKFASR